MTTKDDLAKMSLNKIHELLREDGSYYRELPKHLRMDREMALLSANAKNNPLTFIPQYFTHDEEVVLAIIKNHPSAVIAASKELLNSRQFALEAVYINGLIIKHFPEVIRDDFVVAFTAVQQNKNAYNFLSMKLRANKIIYDIYCK